MLAQFASAFNAGDGEAIRAVLSSEFWALSLTLAGQNETAYGRDDALRYAVQRQRAGDRLAFIRVQVNELAGWDGAAQIGPVVFLLRRGATSTELQGKGALYCRGGARGIKVLGLADSVSVAPAASPTLPPDWSLREASGLRIAAPAAWLGPEVLPRLTGRQARPRLH